MEKVKVIFAGTGGFAVPVLESLVKDPVIEVTSVITGKDEVAGRGLKVTSSPVKIFAVANKLIVHQPAKIEEVSQKIIQEKPDFLVVVSYGQIIPVHILQIAKHASINIHGSLLPKYRGSSPIQEALRQGDEETGVSWIVMAEKMDAGAIIKQLTVPIDKEEGFIKLSAKLADISARNTPNVLTEYLKKPRATRQDETKASYCSLIKKSDGLIDVYKEDALQIVNKVRAYEQWPGCFLFFGDMRIKVVGASVSEQKISTGELKAEKNSLLVGTKNKSLVLVQVQPENKRPMSIAEFLRGQRSLPKSL